MLSTVPFYHIHCFEFLSTQISSKRNFGLGGMQWYLQVEIPESSQVFMRDVRGLKGMSLEVLTKFRL
jgi:hypothetical protein